MTEERDYPSPQVVETFMMSGMSEVDAVSEFIDNSFGQEAGQAEAFHFVRFDGGYLFWDNGVGISDVRLMFRLGAGASRHHAQGIGKFGVGSKFGALSFGSCVTVHTVHKGVYHKHTVDWGKVVKDNEWPKTYSGAGIVVAKNPQAVPAAIRTGGTMIVVTHLHKGKTKHRMETLARALAVRFSTMFPGHTIKLFDMKRIDPLKRPWFASSVTPLNVASFAKSVITLSRENTTRTTVLGALPITVRMGALGAFDQQVSGVHISFAGRVIEHLRDLGDEPLPSQLYVSVDLGQQWKNNLSFNKTKVERYRDELLDAVRAITAELRSELRANESERRVEIILGKIGEALMASATFRDMLTSMIADVALRAKNERQGRGGTTHKPGDGKPRERKHDTPASVGDDRPASAPRTMVEVKADENLGKIAYNASTRLTDDGVSITVLLNPTTPHMAAVLASPVNSPALNSTVATAITSALIDNQDMARAVLPNLADEFGIDDSASAGDLQRALFSKLIACIPEQREPKH